MSSDLEQIIEHQASELARLARENARLRDDVATPSHDPYWEGVYDRALIAWDAFALAELGTRTPTALDLKGRPELAALYEALK